MRNREEETGEAERASPQPAPWQDREQCFALSAYIRPRTLMYLLECVFGVHLCFLLKLHQNGSEDVKRQYRASRTETEIED